MRLLYLLSVFAAVFTASCLDNSANRNATAQMNRSQQNSSSSNANAHTSANSAANLTAPNTTGEIPIYGYEVVRIYKHDQNAFTQGLIFHNGFLFESTGQNGNSTMRKVEFETGTVKARHKLEDRYFAEGATILNDNIYQITWREGRCFVYDAATLEPTANFQYAGEGWGLTNDGTNLIMSDGSNVLTFRSPTDFRATRTVNVTHNGKPLNFLNELEYINGEIWANIWHSEDATTYLGEVKLANLGKPNYIARINPADGKVTGWLDLDGISPDDTDRDNENTLNGIAFDAAANRIFVTGKKWRKLFEIKIKPKNA